jgi:hypothetical protein
MVEYYVIMKNDIVGEYLLIYKDVPAVLLSGIP